MAAASDAESADSLRVRDDILASFPLGWEGEDPWGRDDGLPGWGAGGWIAHVLGWLFTAAAVSLGAPFWFDLLSRVAKLRGTGGGRGGVNAYCDVLPMMLPLSDIASTMCASVYPPAPKFA